MTATTTTIPTATATATNIDGVSLLELQRVVKGFGTTPVLQGCFRLEKGEQVALVGPSGCGKSTLLHLISGILKPESGTIRLADTVLTELTEEKRDVFRAKQIGYVFQTFHLLEGLTALENVEAAVTFADGQNYEQAQDILIDMGLGDRLHYFPHQLSVGQRQRVAVARAVVNHPSLILADEPTANLDTPRAQEVISLLRETSRKNEAALIVATHDSQVVSEFDRVVEFLAHFQPTSTPSLDSQKA